MASGTRANPRWETVIAVAVIVASGLAAYHGIFHAPFIFDDAEAIIKNPTLRHLGALGDVLATPPGASGASGRPLVNLSLALNYAIGGLDVWGYHAWNLAIHLLAGLALFGVVRRTLRIVAFGAPTAAALCVALLWTVHPLLTESVTFTIQRNESMMALFYLLTLYCFIRSSGNREVLGKIWATLSIACCLLGMATKEVMVSAPVIVLLYDRTFLAGSFAEAWRRRRGYYLGLAATWLLLALLVFRQHGARGNSAGFGLGLSVASYALTQCWGIVHYLWLALWPHPLVLDYGRDVIKHAGEVVPEGLFLLALLAATGVALVWRSPARPQGYRWLGFLGACFFAILAPSSSVIPLPAQTVAEHRMYLPLAVLLTGAVVGLYALIGRRTAIVCCCWAAGLGWLTLARNQDYRSEVAIWGVTAAQRPGNARAQLNLGVVLANAGRLPEAEACYEAALRIDPNYADAERDLGDALRGSGRSAEAITHYRRALRLQPDLAEAHNNLGAALGNQGRLAEAVIEFSEAVRLQPDYLEARRNLALARTALASRSR